jgi:hypothetical protein
MKHLTILTLLVITVGCATSYKRIPMNDMRFYTQSRVTLHADKGGLPDDIPADTISVNRGDSVFSFALASRHNRWTFKSDLFYLCAVGKDTLWVEGTTLVSREELDCQHAGGIVKLPKSQSDDAWGRATVYVNKHATLRIQVASDNIIDTYNPIVERNGTKSGYGYTITRRSIGDSVLIEIEPKGSPIYSTCHAYQYIKYGK